MATEWITLDEAAARLGCSTRTLQRRIAAGALPSQQREDGRTVVEVAVQRPAVDGAVFDQLQRQADDSSRIAALAAVASEQTALAYRERLQTMELALADARVNTANWRRLSMAAASVGLSAVVAAGFLWGSRGATERHLSDMRERLAEADAAASSLQDGFTAATAARQMADRELARLREQVDAMQTLGFTVSDDCRDLVADASN